MAYNVTKFDGTPLVTIIDGSFNDSQTDIKLLGKGVSTFGEIMAENLVWLTENFASDGGIDNNTAPSKPLLGQVWYNKNPDINKLFVYKGETLGWSALGGATVGGSSQAPTNPLEGDFWYDTDTQQLKVYTDTMHGGSPGWDIVGPSIHFDSTPVDGIPQVYPAGQNSVDPIVKAEKDGDLWWDTGNKQLYVYNGYQGVWKLVGPASPGGDSVPVATAFSGLQTATLIETDTTENSVIKLVLDDTDTVAVFSKSLVSSGYTPNIPEFDIVYQGLNLEGHIVPNLDSSWYLGTSNKRWNRLYVDELFVTNGIQTDLDAGGNNILNLADPVNAQDAVTLGYANTHYVRLDATTTPTVTNTYNIGSSSKKWNTIYATTFDGTATAAQYADIAERYAVDNHVEPGDIVRIGGEAEVTKTTESFDIDVFGVVSTAPAYMMNSEAGPDKTHPYIALAGRVPAKVKGKVKKGQRLVTSSEEGVAMAVDNTVASNNMLAIIGRALEDKEDENTALIEITIGTK